MFKALFSFFAFLIRFGVALINRFGQIFSSRRVGQLAFAFVFAIAFMFGVDLSAAAIAAPDMTDAIGSVTNVFGAVLGVAVLIFGFKKIKGLL